MRNGLQGPKVMIGDDSEILNNLLKDVFELNGFEVVQAFDGFQCKALFLKENPAITFLDVRMPEADGIDVLRFIKKKVPEALVVMMTGVVGSEETAVKAMKLGADDYLTKPFETEQVVELAKKLLQNRADEKENARLKKEIRRVEKHLAQLTRIINEAFITTDHKGSIEFINRAASDMWGYSSEELAGKDIHLLVRGEARTLLYRDLVKETIRLGRIEGEFHFRKKNGASFPGYLSASLIRENERVRGIVFVVADLTRVYEVESRLKQTEKLASLGKVVEGVAHEVRNCLTSLGGFAMRLRKITEGIPDCDTFTRIILDDVARLENMVHQIEEYVRFSRFYSFHFRKVDIAGVIERAHSRVLSQLTTDLAKPVSFSLRFDKDVPKVTGDTSALEEIFYNLILNAYEAMPGGGKLAVTIKDHGSAISVSVKDQGMGIPKEDLSEIFNPFFTSKTSGAGMGLSKVYLLVEEHRGSINVTSEPNKGTTFEVFLPLERLMTGLFAGEIATGSGTP